MFGPMPILPGRTGFGSARLPILVGPFLLPLPFYCLVDGVRSCRFEAWFPGWVDSLYRRFLGCFVGLFVPFYPPVSRYPLQLQFVRWVGFIQCVDLIEDTLDDRLS